MSWKAVAETGLSVAGSLLGGVAGNTLEAGVDGYKSYEDFRSGDKLGGWVEGGEAALHVGEAVVDGVAGDWL